MIKKITLLAASLFGLLVAGNAKPVSVQTAQNVASSIYTIQSGKTISDIQLNYAEVDQQGDTVFYVFAINNNSGFAIISAEDALHPLIGFGTEGGFHRPTTETSVAGFLYEKKREIVAARSNGIEPNAAIRSAWSVANNKGAKLMAVGAATATTYPSVSALCQTTWNQSPYFNDSCPSQSVTGCVATAMSQIMKYWNYPTTGIGYSSYCDCTSDGFSKNYGTLHANYGATTYNWSNMPNALSTHNASVAQLLYHAGVSVQMDYTPTGSGANVITADGPISAQRSLAMYFGYDSLTMRGLKRGAYPDSVWTAMIMDDLTKNRPVEYAGDSGNQGHTWVLDGYDANTGTFHMNWGWGGYANGYYALNKLNPDPSYFFNSNHEILIGIQPIKNAAPLTDFTASVNYLCGSGNVSFTDLSSNLPNAWNWSFTGGTPATSTSQNPTIAYSTPGRYNVTLVAKNNYGTGTSEVKTGYVTIVASALPAVCKPLTTTPDLGSGIGITNVRLNTINNTSGDAASDGGYMDFSCIKTTVLKTSTSYTGSIQVGDYNAEYVEVYIDYNNNGVFTDAGELVYSGSNLKDSNNFTFTTPAAPVKGKQLRMRVMDHYNPINGSCANLSYGQAEDYAVSFDSPAGLAAVEDELSIVNLYPNPAAQQANLVFNLNQNGLVVADLMDLAGKKVLTIANENMSEGEHAIVINLSQLNEGFYLARIHTNAGEKILKLQVVK